MRRIGAYVIHLCACVFLLAQSYVSMHMAATISCASTMMDWTHEKTELSDEIQ